MVEEGEEAAEEEEEVVMGRCKSTGKVGEGEKKADGARASSLCLVCDDEWDGRGG